MLICRYVDDIFCTLDSKGKMDQFFYNLNKVQAFQKSWKQTDNWHIWMSC